MSRTIYSGKLKIKPDKLKIELHKIIAYLKSSAGIKNLSGIFLRFLLSNQLNKNKMKTKRFKVATKNIFLGILATIMIFLSTSCARKVFFITSTVVPGAQGYVQVKKDKNMNYVIQVKISDLAEVAKLQTAKDTYVVWMISDQEKAKNVGQLKSATSMFSKQHKATFKSVSSSKPTKIFITAENDGNVQYPGAQIVLSTDGF